MAMIDPSLDPLDMDVVTDVRRVHVELGYEPCWSWKLSMVDVSRLLTDAGVIASATTVKQIS